LGKLGGMALLSALLKEVLVCPVCRGELEEDEARSLLRCLRDATEFPVVDGVPMMLVGAEQEQEAPLPRRAVPRPFDAQGDAPGRVPA